VKHKEVVVSLVIWGVFWSFAILGGGCPGTTSAGQATCQFFEEHSDVLDPIYLVLYAAAILSTFACIFIPVLRNQLPS
jgi:hypothetical protein